VVWVAAASATKPAARGQRCRYDDSKESEYGGPVGGARVRTHLVGDWLLGSMATGEAGVEWDSSRRLLELPISSLRCARAFFKSAGAFSVVEWYVGLVQ